MQVNEIPHNVGDDVTGWSNLNQILLLLHAQIFPVSVDINYKINMKIFYRNLDAHALDRSFPHKTC